jgi:hypothetical protein
MELNLDRSILLSIEPEALAWADKNCPAQFRDAIGYASQWGMNGFASARILAWLDVPANIVFIDVRYIQKEGDRRDTGFFMRAIWREETKRFEFNS